MKIINKIDNLHISIKIVIMVIILAFIALINFAFYNYQALKLTKEQKGITSVNLANVTNNSFEKKDSYLISKENEATLSINFNYKYVRNLIIEYETENIFKMDMESERANEYGIYKEYTKDATCYNFLNRTAFPFNQKVGNVKLTFGSKDVTIKSIKVDNSIYFNWRTFGFWAIIVELILLIILFKNILFAKLHILSFILCFSLGAVFLICTHNTTSTTLDDDTHYARYNSLKSSNFYSVSDYYMENVIAPFSHQDTNIEIKDYQQFLDDGSNKYYFSKDDDGYNKRVNFLNLLEPGMLNYLPTSILLKVLSFFKIKYTTKVFIVRLMKLMIYSLVIAISIKIIPIYKLLVLLIGLIPQSLFLAVNFSYDPVVNMFLILAISIFIKEYHEKNKLTLKSALMFTMASLIGILPKAIYAPILLVGLILPKDKFRDKKQMYCFKGVLIGLFITCMLTFVIPLINNPKSLDDSRGGNTSAVQQVKLILRNPTSFINVFWREAVLKTPHRLVSPDALGLLSYYGSMKCDVSYLLIWLAIIIASVGERKKDKMKLSNRFILFSILFTIICFIWGSMYLGYTPVGENTINGVQCRYFLPLYLPLLYVFSSPSIKSNLDEKKMAFMVTTMYILSYIVLIYNVLILNYFL